MVFEKSAELLKQAMAIGNQAAALEGMQQLDAAIEAYSKSAEMLEKLGETELRAYVLQSVSALQMKRGHYLEAYATMREGVMGIDKPNFKQRLVKSLMGIPFRFLR